MVKFQTRFPTELESRVSIKTSDLYITQVKLMYFLRIKRAD